ncbi:MAG: ester cyclase [Flavisolibacter sp.]
MKMLLISLALVAGFVMCNSKSQQVNNTVDGDKAVQEKNKNIIKSVFTELINKRNTIAIYELYDQKMVDHGAWEDQAPGIEGFRKAVKDFIEMFPDLQVTVDNMITAGDMVATKDSWKGTHAATKKEVTGETMHVFRIVNGKITDEWSNGWEWLEGL